MSKRTINKLLKSVLKTAVCFLEQTDDIAEEAQGRIAKEFNRASDRVSELRDHTRGLYKHENHALRNVAMFAAGIGLGIGSGMLFAPASGTEIRTSIGDKVQDFSKRVRTRVFSEPATANGTEER